MGEAHCHRLTPAYIRIILNSSQSLTPIYDTKSSSIQQQAALLQTRAKLVHGRSDGRTGN